MRKNLRGCKGLPARAGKRDQRCSDLLRHVFWCAGALIMLLALPGRAQSVPANSERLAKPVPLSTSPANAVGEAQARFLLKMVREFSQSSRGVPLKEFRERIARAATTHPDTLAAYATQDAAGEAIREIVAADRPQIAATIDATGQNTDPNTVLQVLARKFETAGVALTLRQNLTDFGANKAAIAAGKHREVAIAARAENRKGDLALRAVQAWLDVYRSRKQLELMHLNVRARETLVGHLVLRQQLEAGLISDVWRAKSRLADARASLAATKARVRNGEAVFREVFREDPGAIELPALPPLDRATLAKSSVEAVREFPGVRSAEAALRAAEQEHSATKRRSYPQVGFEFSAKRRDLVGQGDPGSDLAAALVLRYNFYTGGAETARSAQASYRAVEASEQVRNIRLQVERALSQALADEDSSDAVLAARRDEVTLAADALRAQREIFVNRRGSLLDLLNSQEVLHSAGLALVDAQVERAQSRWRVLYFSAAFAQVLGLEPYRGAHPR